MITPYSSEEISQFNNELKRITSRCVSEDISVVCNDMQKNLDTLCERLVQEKGILPVCERNDGVCGVIKKFKVTASGEKDIKIDVEFDDAYDLLSFQNSDKSPYHVVF